MSMSILIILYVLKVSFQLTVECLTIIWSLTIVCIFSFVTIHGYLRIFYRKSICLILNSNIRGVVKKFVTARNSLLIIKSNKMFVDKYALYTLSLVIFLYFNVFHIKPLL